MDIIIASHLEQVKLAGSEKIYEYLDALVQWIFEYIYRTRYVPRLSDKIRVLIIVFIRLNDQASIKSASSPIAATVAGKIRGSLWTSIIP